MSGNASQLNSKHGRKCNGKDMISEMHDDVLVRILSFLPLKEAAATSLVAPRWSQLWRYIPNLIFKKNSDLELEMATHCNLKTIGWVNSVTNSHKALFLKQFTIESYLHDFQFLPKWLHFALSRRVEILKFNFIDPNFMDDSSSVVDIDIMSGIQSSDYKFLKELTLENVAVTGEAVELFVHNSPLLERLTLNVSLRSNLVITGGTFNHFEIRCRESYDILIKVSAPNLARLRCNCSPSMLFLEDVPNLADVSCDLYDGDTLDCFANATSNLEILTIFLESSQAFSTPQMPKLTKLFVELYTVNKEFPLPITDLLWASPCLQEFRLKVTYKGDRYAKYTRNDRIFEAREHGKSPHHHLNVFEFSGFYGMARDHVDLLKYIVDNCVALQEMIISPLLEIRYPKFPKRMMIKYPENSRCELLPASYESDDDVDCEERERHLRIRELMGRILAVKVPHHINLLIGHYNCGLFTYDQFRNVTILTLVRFICVTLNFVFFF